MKRINFTEQELKFLKDNKITLKQWEDISIRYLEALAEENTN